MACQKHVYLGYDIAFSVPTHNVATGRSANATGSVAYRVYQDDNDDAVLLTGTMPRRDTSNTTGLYMASFTCSAGNGFQRNASYNVEITATVSGIQGSITHGFRVL